MEYFKMFFGATLIVGLGWLIATSRKRAGLSKYLLDPDLMLGFIAGIYLLCTSVHALIQ